MQVKRIHDGRNVVPLTQEFDVVRNSSGIERSYQLRIAAIHFGAN